MPKRARQPQPLKNRLVVALACDGLCTFEFGVAVEIFGLDRPEMGGNWYKFRVAAIEPGVLRAMGGILAIASGRPMGPVLDPDERPSSTRTALLFPSDPAGAAPCG